MQQSLRVIQRMVKHVYSELHVVMNDNNLNEKSYKLLKQAAIDAIDLQRKIEEAYGWGVVEQHENLRKIAQQGEHNESTT